MEFERHICIFREVIDFLFAPLNPMSKSVDNKLPWNHEIEKFR